MIPSPLSMTPDPCDTDFVYPLVLTAMLCSFDNAEVYEAGKAEEVMGQAFKVNWTATLF